MFAIYTLTKKSLATFSGSFKYSTIALKALCFSCGVKDSFERSHTTNDNATTVQPSFQLNYKQHVSIPSVMIIILSMIVNDIC